MKLVLPTHDVDEYLALEYLASEPYTRFVYEGEDETRAITRFLFEGAASEVAAPYGSLVVDDDGTTLGMLSVLDRAELGSARMAAAMALLRAKRIDPMSGVRARMMLAAATLVAVDDEELYLSRIAVAPAARGRGVGGWLMNTYERIARERGKSRLVLEVSPGHGDALRLYERHAFVLRAEHRAVDPETGRELVYRHLTKQLT